MNGIHALKILSSAKNTNQKLFSNSLKAIWKYPNLYKSLWVWPGLPLVPPLYHHIQPSPWTLPEQALCAPVLPVCPKLWDAPSALPDSLIPLSTLVPPWMPSLPHVHAAVTDYPSSHHHSGFSLQPGQAHLPWPTLLRPSSETRGTPGLSPAIWIVICSYCWLPDGKLPGGRNCGLSWYFQCFTPALRGVNCYSLRNEWMNKWSILMDMSKTQYEEIWKWSFKVFHGQIFCGVPNTVATNSR